MATRAASAPPRARARCWSGGYTVGVLVQCNYGTRDNLRIAGVPVGREIPAPEPYAFMPSDMAERGSIIVVVATDAPLLPHQLKRLARRVTWVWGATAAFRATARATFSSHFPRPTPARRPRHASSI